MSTVPEIRNLPVPDGLEGERVDAAISRMFGFSRTKAAELAARAKAMVDGSVVGKSERVHGGAWLEVDAVGARAGAARGRAGGGHGDGVLRRARRDRQAGRGGRAPAAGLGPGPTVIGGLAAAGYRISTSGAAERQGIVHRLDVGPRA